MFVYSTSPIVSSPALGHDEDRRRILNFFRRTAALAEQRAVGFERVARLWWRQATT